MKESDFEGTVILEKMAALEKIDEFFDAIDSDDFEKVKFLLRQANVDHEIIAMVIQKMMTGDSRD
ncbi:MAG: hypothetical protein KDD34_00215 [Bdellovibrionales bacterium]|nr:hypothetical protein [Bdellovibrionales bacterium]MCB0406589.1 hypothetical protein [Bdellovibrionales bacterium]